MRKNYLDFIIYFLSYALNPICSLLVYPFITDYFTPTEYGEYIYWVTLLSLVSTLLLNWVSPVILRFLNKGNMQGQFLKYKSHIILIIILNIIAYFILSLVVISLIKKTLVVLIIFDLLIFGIMNNVFAYLRANGRSMKLSMYIFIQIIFKYTTLFLLMQLKLESTYILFIGGTIASTILLLILGIKHIKSLKLLGHINKNLIKELYVYGLPFTVTAISGVIINASDRVLIKKILKDGDYYVGIYSINNNIYTQIIYLIILTLTTMIPYKLFMHYDLKNFEKYNRGLLDIFKIFLVASTYMHIFTVLNKKYIDLLLIDKKFWVDSQIASAFMVGFILFGMFRIVGSYYEASKKTKYLAYLLIVGGGINFVLNISLLHVFGFSIAAYTTIIAYSILFILSFRMIRKNYGFNLDAISVVLISFNFLIMLSSNNLTLQLIMHKRVFIILYLLVSFFIIPFISIFILLIKRRALFFPSKAS